MMLYMCVVANLALSHVEERLTSHAATALAAREFAVLIIGRPFSLAQL
jgi:hypothetical protein